VPLLTINSWQDDQTGSRIGHMYTRLEQDRSWAVLTNGDHFMYGRSTPYIDLLKRFFRRYLLDERNGWEETPRFQVWHEASRTTREPSWVSSHPAWPPRTEPLALDLRADGALLPAPPGTADPPDRYEYPRPAPTVNAFAIGPEAALVNDSQALQWRTPAPRDGAVAFTTPRLDRDVEVLGPATLNVWLASTAADTDLQVTITEVRPDGQEVFVQRGWQRMSHRRLDAARSTEMLPFHTHMRADHEPLRPGEATPARVEVFPFGHVFRAGSSIRVLIDAPTGGTGLWSFEYHRERATNTVFHDAAHRSQLVLALVPGGSARAPLPPCDSVLYEPCRENTLPVPPGTLDPQSRDPEGLPTRPSCADDSRPRSRLIRGRSQVARRGVRLRGFARDRGCRGDARTSSRRGAVARVQVAIGRRARGRRCAFLRRNGRLTGRRRCDRPVRLTASGTRRWSLRVPARLRSGTYVVSTRAVDLAGNRERRSRRSVHVFKVR
jgi:hypothetical protein